MTERKPLPSPVARVLAGDLPAAEVDRLWHGHEERQRSRRARSRRAALTWAALVACGLLGFALGRFRPPAAAPASEATPPTLPAVLSAGDVVRRFVLSDGSWIDVAPGALVRTEAETDEDVRLTLVTGRVEIEVRPGGRRRWQLESALARVLVVGTRFTVDASEDVTSVRVAHGAVRVLSPWIDEAVRVLSSGESLTVTRDPPREPIAVAVEAPRADARAPHPRPAAPSPVTPPPVEAADDLFRRADDARRAGTPQAAVGPLERILELHPDDPDGALAAFTLGRLYDDVLDDDARARASLLRARAIGLPSLLDAEASRRLTQLAPEDPAEGSATP